MIAFIFIFLSFFIGSNLFASESSEEIEAKRRLISIVPHTVLCGKVHTPTYEEATAYLTREIYSKFSLNQNQEALMRIELLAQCGELEWQVKYSKILLEGLDDFESNETKAEKYYKKAALHQESLFGEVRNIFLELHDFFINKENTKKLTYKTNSLSLIESKS